MEEVKPPYNCPWCGAPAWCEPGEIPPPPDYCWESDHGSREEYLEDIGEDPSQGMVTSSQQQEESNHATQEPDPGRTPGSA